MISRHLPTEMTKTGSSELFPMRFPVGCGLCLAKMVGQWSKMLSRASSTLSLLDEAKARKQTKMKKQGLFCFVSLVFFVPPLKTSLESKNCCLREAYRG